MTAAKSSPPPALPSEPASETRLRLLPRVPPPPIAKLPRKATGKANARNGYADIIQMPPRELPPEPAPDVPLSRVLRREECRTWVLNCALVACRHNTANGAPPRMRATSIYGKCALTFAEQSDGATLEEVGAFLSITRERVRQIEYRAIRKLRRSARGRELLAMFGHEPGDDQ